MFCIGWRRGSGSGCKGILILWWSSSLELQAGLELHQDFNDVFHLIQQDSWKVELCASLCTDSLTDSLEIIPRNQRTGTQLVHEASGLSLSATSGALLSSHRWLSSHARLCWV